MYKKIVFIASKIGVGCRDYSKVLPEMAADPMASFSGSQSTIRVADMSGLAPNTSHT